MTIYSLINEQFIKMIVHHSTCNENEWMDGRTDRYGENTSTDLDLGLVMHVRGDNQWLHLQKFFDDNEPEIYHII